MSPGVVRDLKDVDDDDMAFPFYFVVKGRACSLIIFTHYVNALKASARDTKLHNAKHRFVLFKCGRDHKQSQYHPEECASYFSRHPEHLRGKQKLVPLRCLVVYVQWKFSTLCLFL